MLKSTIGWRLFLSGSTAACCTMYDTSLTRSRLSVMPVISQTECIHVTSAVIACSQNGFIVAPLVAHVGWWSDVGSDVYDMDDCCVNKGRGSPNSIVMIHDEDG